MVRSILFDGEGRKVVRVVFFDSRRPIRELGSYSILLYSRALLGYPFLVYVLVKIELSRRESKNTTLTTLRPCGHHSVLIAHC